MSTGQWKIVHLLKESLAKLASDRALLTKDLIQRLPYHVELTGYLLQRKHTAAETPDEKNKRTKEDRPPAGAPKWRRPARISKESIASQTAHALQAVRTAESAAALQPRVEALIAHALRYPESRSGLGQAGAVRLLLRARARHAGEEVQGALREALALLGHAAAAPGRGIRILSIDGGGIRGLLVLTMLRKLEELTGRETHELFDLLCGVSTGAILSLSIGAHRRPLSELAAIYKEISTEVFQQSALRGTGSLVWSQAYYDTALWEAKLRQYLGTGTLIGTARRKSCPKLCAVSAVVNQTHLSAFVFRNYTFPWRVKSQYFGNSTAEVWQAARASAAAPTIFEEFKLGNCLHQDGGILVNNPTAVALHEAKLIWPNTPVQCVVSFGTGRSVPSPADFNKDTVEKAISTSWANKFYKILDSATDTEGVHIMLNDLLPDNVYYRFNPYLAEVISMVETHPKKIEQLERDVLMYLRRNEDKFQEAAHALLQKKGRLRQIKDVINYQRDYYGI